MTPGSLGDDCPVCLLVDQQPVRLDMTFPAVFTISFQFMKPVFLVERLPVQQFIDDLQELLFILAGF